MRAYNFYINTDSYLKGISKNIHIDPHLPYLYMPLADWTHFGLTINTLYATNPLFDDCDVTGNYCRFKSSCSAV